MDISVKIGNLTLKTPILTASGTVGHGDELKIIDFRSVFKDVGAFVTKGITLNSRIGNKPIRLIETNYGLLNSIGLQNKGVDYFFQKELSTLRKYKIPVIINIAGETIEEYGELAKRIVQKEEDQDIYQGIEINVSCPNIACGGYIFGSNKKDVYEIVKVVKEHFINSNKIIIVKLSPNVTNIVDIGQYAIKGGADALSLINTVKAMCIDINTRKPILGNIYGGLSGPAIKPIGIRMVYECYKGINECNKKKIPIIGIGGITTSNDALEYFMAGASAIGIGTAFYYSFNIFSDVNRGIRDYLKKKRISLDEIVGIAHR